MQRIAAACEAAPDLAVCTEACELGHSNSCARAGDQSRDAAAARALHQRACDGGSGLGCAAAGIDDKARFYARVHCDQRHAASCLLLSHLFRDGRGGPPDARAAITFLERACAFGLRAACDERAAVR